MKIKHVAAVDVGFRFTNVVKPKTEVVTFPSLVAVARKGFEAELFDQSQTIQVGEQTYVVGEEADTSLNAFHTLDRNRTNLDEFKVLFLSALTRLFPNGGKGLGVITGLPHAELSDSGLVKEKLRGSHRVKLNGKSRLFEIVDVRVIPQAFGTLINEIYNYNGTGLKIQAPELRTETSLTIDFGGYTTGFQKFQGERYISKDSGSIEHGMIEVLHTLIADIKASKLNIDLTLPEADQALRKGFVEIYKRPYDITHISEPILVRATEAVNSKALSLWGKGQTIEHVLLTGGGAHAMAHSFKLLYEHPLVKVVTDPHTANVRGYLLYALGLRGEGIW